MRNPGPILLVGDPLERLKRASDSSLALAEAALARGREVHWCEPPALAVMGASVAVGSSHRLLEASNIALRHEPVPGGARGLDHYAQVWVRKDPPFDERYKSLCWILASQSSVPVVNPAEKLLAYHEKALQWRARAAGVLRDWEVVPTCVTSDPALAAAFVEEYARNAAGLASAAPQAVPGGATSLRWIVKPWLGYAGHGVEAFDDPSAALARFADLVSSTGDCFMIQPFLPEITTHGDRRVFVVRGEVVCDFVRRPAEGKVASNLAQGGRAAIVPLTSAQQDLVRRVAAWLAAEGIAIAGLDLIDTFVGEINITSPTGLRTYESLTGHNVAARAVELLLEEDA